MPERRKEPREGGGDRRKVFRRAEDEEVYTMAHKAMELSLRNEQQIAENNRLMAALVNAQSADREQFQGHILRCERQGDNAAETLARIEEKTEEQTVMLNQHGSKLQEVEGMSYWVRAKIEQEQADAERRKARAESAKAAAEFWRGSARDGLRKFASTMFYISPVALIVMVAGAIWGWDKVGHVLKALVPFLG